MYSIQTSSVTLPLLATHMVAVDRPGMNDNLVRASRLALQLPASLSHVPAQHRQILLWPIAEPWRRWTRRTPYFDECPVHAISVSARMRARRTWSGLVGSSLSVAALINSPPLGVCSTRISGISLRLALRCADR